MSSVARSALVPISRTTSPFTVTRPSAMTRSAARREAMPARDRIFWIRSCMEGFYRAGCGRTGLVVADDEVEQHVFAAHHLDARAVVEHDVGQRHLGLAVARHLAGGGLEHIADLAAAAPDQRAAAGV